MNVSDTIRLKRAVRKFTDQTLPEDVILAILKALSECGEWASHLAGAALGVAILTPNPSEKFQTMFDAGQAAFHRNIICASPSHLAIRKSPKY